MTFRTSANIAEVDEERCAQFGLDAGRVLRIARRLARAAHDARALGLTVFGGSGVGSLRSYAAGSGTDAEVARLGPGFDGGDGGPVVVKSRARIAWSHSQRGVMPKELDFSQDRGVRFSQYFGERSFADSPELEADKYARTHHAIARTTGSVQGVDPFPQ